MQVEFTIAAEAANVKEVTVQVTQDRGQRRVLGSKRVLEVYLSSDAAGETPTVPASDDFGVVTDGGAGALLATPASSAHNVAKVLTDATGKVDLDLTNAADGGATRYLNVIDPATGKVHTSGAITWADDTP